MRADTPSNVDPDMACERTDSRCAFGVAIHGYDVALEGRAARVTDGARLQRLAWCSPKAGGRPLSPTVASPTSSLPPAGPPPWYVYEFTPRTRTP